jgi:DNA polymerase-4
VVLETETAFDSDLADPAAIGPDIRALADKVWTWCERTGARARTVTNRIRWADFQQTTRSRSLAGPIQDAKTLARTGVELMRSETDPNVRRCRQ